MSPIADVNSVLNRHRPLFINGRKEVGALTLEQFDAILAPLLAETAKTQQ